MMRRSSNTFSSVNQQGRFVAFQRADDPAGQHLVGILDFLGQRTVVHIDVLDLVGIAAGITVQFLGDVRGWW